MADYREIIGTYKEVPAALLKLIMQYKMIQLHS